MPRLPGKESANWMSCRIASSKAASAPGLTRRRKTTVTGSCVIMCARPSAVRRSQDLLHGDRQVAHSLARRVIDGVRNRWRHRYGGELAHALCPERSEEHTSELQSRLH